MADSSRPDAPPAPADRARVAGVLDFWFGVAGSAEHDRPRAVWFKRDASFDAACGAFLADYREAAAGLCDHWLAWRDATLALVLLLDQLPRNLFRDSPRAYATDGAARRAASTAVARGFDVALAPVRRRFVYMPFMHSEDLADQERSVTLFETMQGDPDNADSLRAARHHRGIVARFGRFPHRNAILGRGTTPEEAAFLAGPDAGF
jgi:uncharacterized protein (DUF924 family)